MKAIFKTVISKGDYDLTTLLNKIDTYYVEGKLSEADRAELYNLARATPKAQYNIQEEIEKLWSAIRELQNKEVDTDVKDFIQPTGAHNAYHIGDRVRYKGYIYTCLLDNCVWSPDTLPSAWEKE